mgnify:CR=1 FL=1
MGHETKPTQRTSQKLVQITLSNALDQSEKRLIEISPSQSVRTAVVDAGMAPSGQFDVFSSVGEVVTNKVATQVEGETLYVGPARIAGGAFEPGEIVALHTPTFHGELARIIHVDFDRNEVTIELINPVIPIPFSIHTDHISLFNEEGE